MESSNIADLPGVVLRTGYEIRAFVCPKQRDGRVVAPDMCEPDMVIDFTTKREANGALAVMQEAVRLKRAVDEDVSSAAQAQAAAQAAAAAVSKTRVRQASRLRHAGGGELFRLDKLALTLSSLSGESVRLQRHEALLLEAFVMSKEYALDFADIADVLGWKNDPKLRNALYVRLIRLRKKMESIGAKHDCIKAVHGWGYQLCEYIVVP